MPNQKERYVYTNESYTSALCCSVTALSPVTVVSRAARPGSQQAAHQA